MTVSTTRVNMKRTLMMMRGALAMLLLIAASGVIYEEMYYLG